MSNIILGAGPSGSGSLTLQAPNTNSAQMATFPDSTGTVVTTGTPQSGSVLQVIQSTLTTGSAYTSTSYADISGLSATITPKFSTSKVLVMYRVNGSNNISSNMNAFQITRNTTAIGNGSNSGQWPCHSAVRGQYSDGNPLWTSAGMYLDSPASISALTYQIQYRVDGNTGYINRDPSNGATLNYATPLSTITLMEIAG